MIVIHTDRGLEDDRPRAYWDRVDRGRRVEIGLEKYHTGVWKANYPVPAKIAKEGEICSGR